MKADVLIRYPNAYAYQWANGWTIYATRPEDMNHIGLSLGDGSTARGAWHKAANAIHVKEAVRAKWPTACAVIERKGWRIATAQGMSLGSGSTERAAWNSAYALSITGGVAA